jgi:hypothetical protein
MDFLAAVHAPYHSGQVQGQGQGACSPTGSTGLGGLGCAHCQLVGRRAVAGAGGGGNGDGGPASAPVMESCWLGMFLGNVVQQAFLTSNEEEGQFVLEGFGQ